MWFLSSTKRSWEAENYEELNGKVTWPPSWISPVATWGTFKSLPFCTWKHSFTGSREATRRVKARRVPHQASVPLDDKSVISGLYSSSFGHGNLFRCNSTSTSWSFQDSHIPPTVSLFHRFLQQNIPWNPLLKLWNVFMFFWRVVSYIVLILPCLLSSQSTQYSNLITPKTYAARSEVKWVGDVEDRWGLIQN